MIKNNYYYLLIIFFSFWNNSHGQILTETFEISKSTGRIQTNYVDLNNDGHLDLVILSALDLAYYLGDGNNNFGMKKVIRDSISTSVVEVSNMQIGDIDQNGFLDIIISLSADRIEVFYNDNLSFQRDYINDGALHLTKVFLIDIDVDGDLDLLSVGLSGPYTANGRTRVHWNNNGSFMPSTVLLNIGVLNSFKRKDLNGDGREDYAFINYGGTSVNKIMVWRNVSLQPMTWTLPDYNNRAIRDFEFFDVNEDGLLDIVCMYDGEPTTIVWWENNGQNFTSRAVTVPSRPNVNALRMQDVDNDGRLDLIAGSASKIFWYKINSPTDFSYQGELISSNISSVSFQLTDINEDGFFDILVREDYAVKHFLNDGNNVFGQYKEVASTPFSPFGVKIADFDGDGLKDVIYSGGVGSKNLVWQKNLGNDVFTEQKIIESPYFDLHSFDVADMDNDGDIDIIGSCNISGQTNKLTLFRNNGTGTFQSTILGDALKGGLSLVDIDLDGDLDVVGASTTNASAQKLLIYYNNGTGSFTSNQITSNSLNKNYPLAADLDNDGDNDIMLIQDGKLRWHENQGNTFANFTTINLRTSDFKFGDFDGDGLVDMVRHRVQNGTGEHFVYLHKNSGNGLFTDSVLIDYQVLTSANHTKLHVIDYDNDGDLDLFIRNYNEVYYCENIGAGTFAPKELFSSTLYLYSDFQFGDMDNDSRYEIAASLERHDNVISVKQFYTGDTPQIVLDTPVVCPEDTFQISVTNYQALNDNTTWGLFEGGCNGQLLQTSNTGVFEVNLTVESTLYVKSIGGTYSGSCDSISISFIEDTDPPVLTGELLDSTTIKFSWESTNTNVTHWEYRTNGGIWDSLPVSTDVFIFPNVTPNTCIDFEIRGVQESPNCLFTTSAQAQVCTNCFTTNIKDTVYACMWGEYLYPDGTFTFDVQASQTQTSHLTSIYGCDSIIETHVIAYPGWETVIHDTTCRNSQYFFGDGTSQIYTTTGPKTYTYYLTSQNGCDSLIVYRIYVRPTYSYGKSVYVCSGDNYTFQNGHTVYNITAPFTYPDTLNSIYGCDSIINTFVSLTTAYSLFDTIYVCSHSSYTFSNGHTMNNISMNTNYFYTQTYPTACDTNFYIRILVKPYEYVEISEEICQGSTYDFYGDILTDPGFYVKTIPSDEDTCMRIGLTLTLSSVVSPVLTIEEAFGHGECHGYYESLVLNATSPGTLYISGDLSDTIVIASFPFSIDSLPIGLYTLELDNGSCSSEMINYTVEQPFTTVLVYDTICQGEVYDFYSQTITSSGTYVHTNAVECTITELHLNVSNVTPTVTIDSVYQVGDCDNYLLNVVLHSPLGGTLYVTGEMTDSVALTNVYHLFDSLSIGTYNFYVSNGICTSEVVTLVVEDTIGGYQIVLPSIPPICDTAAAIPLNFAYPSGGTYYINGEEMTVFIPDASYIGTNTLTYVLDSLSCVDSVSVTFQVISCSTVSIDALQSHTDILVYPNPTKGVIYIKSDEKVKSKLFDSTGRFLFETDNSEIDLSVYAVGVYYVKITSDQTSETFKIRVEK